MTERTRPLNLGELSPEARQPLLTSIPAPALRKLALSIYGSKAPVKHAEIVKKLSADEYVCLSLTFTLTYSI